MENEFISGGRGGGRSSFFVVVVGVVAKNFRLALLSVKLFKQLRFRHKTSAQKFIYSKYYPDTKGRIQNKMYRISLYAKPNKTGKCKQVRPS